MNLPEPVPGLVIGYSYLWRAEALRGREEGVKNRPCAILLTVVDANGGRQCAVLPITHRAPLDPDHAVEIPRATKMRLGLDDERSWIVLTEFNLFRWPGPDLRPLSNDDPRSIVVGQLPANFFTLVRDRWLALRAIRATRPVPRTE